MKPHNEIHLVTLTPGELDEAYQLYRESLYEFIDQAFGWNEAFQQQRFWSSYPIDSLLWITHVNSSRIGLVSFLNKDQSLHLSLLLLYRAHRGSGLGSLVMRELEGLAEGSGRKITLSTFRENKGAFVFYQKLGYQIDNQDEHFYEMSRELTCRQRIN
ncbi:MAG: GNAT family N-acetyltransferase [Saccharospirillum sp.]|uniref:GNAT family N-acetyltransferase n=1 Tax=Saccharospirillum sp. TaxID=2033801 RepID=UPI003298D513